MRHSFDKGFEENQQIDNDQFDDQLNMNNFYQIDIGSDNNMFFLRYDYLNPNFQQFSVQKIEQSNQMSRVWMDQQYHLKVKNPLDNNLYEIVSKYIKKSLKFEETLYIILPHFPEIAFNRDQIYEMNLMELFLNKMNSIEQIQIDEDFVNFFKPEVFQKDQLKSN